MARVRGWFPFSLTLSFLLADLRFFPLFWLCVGLGGFSRMAYLAVSITDLDVNAMEKKNLGFHVNGSHSS